MTSKTKSRKRQAILDTAIQVFKEMGFHNASMNIIAARVGGSKTTLYNHFPSKEAIFLEVVRGVAMMPDMETSPIGASVLTEASRNRIDTAFLALQDAPEDVRATLLRFGENFLGFLYTPETLTIRRLFFAESRQSEIGRIYYENGPQKALTRLADYLEKAMHAGKLKKTDARLVAAQFRSLLEAEGYEYYLLGIEAPLPAKRIREMAEAAVDVFMAAYGIA